MPDESTPDAQPSEPQAKHGKQREDAKHRKGKHRKDGKHAKAKLAEQVELAKQDARRAKRATIVVSVFSAADVTISATLDYVRPSIAGLVDFLGGVFSGLAVLVALELGQRRKADEKQIRRLKKDQRSLGPPPISPGSSRTQASSRRSARHRSSKRH
jgi:hypothetical protein